MRGKDESNGQMLILMMLTTAESDPVLDENWRIGLYSTLAQENTIGYGILTDCTYHNLQLA